ncbi:MAG: hypothetical protein IJ438_14160, partial [Clostridia bacterium]|nr:hypothetical protein [Clostridia bacterium]
IYLAPGHYEITADPQQLPAGYELAMDDVIPVTVYEDGSLSKEEIAFYYRPAPKTAFITITYLDQSNHIIAGPFTKELSANQTHIIQADASLVPSGYEPDSAAPVEVYVTSDGVANPSDVYLVFAKKVVETPIPTGTDIRRYGTVTGVDVAMRSEPSTAGGKDTVLRRVSKNSKVFLIVEELNEGGELWTKIMIDGQEGYMMSSFLTVMTQAESDQYAASIGATPVPTYTPTPSPSPTPTATPTITPTPVIYDGYALTNRVTAQRTDISADDTTIIQRLEVNELVYVTNQAWDQQTGETWSLVTTLEGQSGYVQNSALRYISDEEAEYYKNLWLEENATPEPTKLATSTPEPIQITNCYAYAVGDNVPFRVYDSEYSRIIDYLPQGTVVLVDGQNYPDGVAWHIVWYDNTWGYIRADMLRLMTVAEQEAYLDSLNATPPTPVTSNQPFDENGLSSYGYVKTSTSVNFREGPTTDSKRIRMLRNYAFCLVLGTEYVDGEAWYNVSYGGETGYIHGNYFHQMSIYELEEFLGSEEYRQGIANNSGNGSSSNDDIGFTGTGGLITPEDEAVNQWTDPNSGVHVSYEPFQPIATVGPINPTATPTLEPLPWETTPVPTQTPTLAPLPNVTYPTNNTEGGSSALVWIIVIALLLVVGGGVFAFVSYQQKRRRIAMRAAQRRAQAARSADRPYARQATQSGQPRTGTYPNQSAQRSNPYQSTGATVRRPANTAPAARSAQTQQPQQTGNYQASQTYVQPQSGASYTPYAAPAESSQYSRPETAEAENTASTRVTGRVGRRAAYRQAHPELEQQSGGDFAKDSDE